MYANNLVKLLAIMVDKEGKLTINPKDDVIAGSLVCHGGEVVHARVREILGLKGAVSGAAAGEVKAEAVTLGGTR